MRILIVGPGAIGRLLAARLALSGQTVSLLDHCPERAAHFEAGGITLVESDGTQQLAQVAASAKAPGGGDEPAPDLVVTCVKSYHLESAIASLGALAGRCHVLVLCNGLGNLERVERRWGADLSLAGTITYGAARDGETGVVATGAGTLRLGSHNQSATPSDIRQVFHNAGISCELVARIDQALWEKAAVNCAINPLAALLRVRNGELVELPLGDELREIIAEVVLVASGEGIHMQPDTLLAQVESICRATAQNYCSMATDLAARRRTEIFALNGAVAERARLQGISAPRNALLTSLIRVQEPATIS